MKGAGALATLISPFARAEVMVDADPARARGPLCEMRQDNRDVTDFGHYRIGLVGSALPKSTRMNVHVGDDRATGLAAMGPEVPEPPTVDHYNAGFKRVRIDVVVEDKLLDRARLIFRAEKKCAALASAAGALLQF